MRGWRVRVAAIVAATAMLGVTSAAAAGTLTFTTSMGGFFGNEVFTHYVYTGAPGEKNDMRLDSYGLFSLSLDHVDTVNINDLAGVTSQAPMCTAAVFVLVCPMQADFQTQYGGRDSLVLNLGDGNDKIRHHYGLTAPGSLEPVDDTQYQCSVRFAPPGPPLPSRSCHAYTIDAGAGDDFVDIQDHVRQFAHPAPISSCGPGFDIVLRDPGEIVPADCEVVSG